MDFPCPYIQFAGNPESTNLSRDNLSREIGRSQTDTLYFKYLNMLDLTFEHKYTYTYKQINQYTHNIYIYIYIYIYKE